MPRAASSPACRRGCARPRASAVPIRWSTCCSAWSRCSRWRWPACCGGRASANASAPAGGRRRPNARVPVPCTRPQRASVAPSAAAEDDAPADSVNPAAWRPTVEIPELDSGDVPRRAVSAEELIDLEQQAEFFVMLGQDDAAVDLLLNHIAQRRRDQPAALPEAARDPSPSRRPRGLRARARAVQPALQRLRAELGDRNAPAVRSRTTPT